MAAEEVKSSSLQPDQLTAFQAALGPYNLWIRLGILLAVLALAAGIGFLGGSLANSRYWFVPYLFAALPVALIVIEFVLQRHDLAGIFILGMAAFVPLKVPTGTGSPLVGSLLLTIALVILWIVRMWLLDRRFWLYPSPINRPLLGFMLVTVVAFLWSNLLVDPLVNWRLFSPVQIGATIVMLMLPAAFLVVANVSNDLKILKGMTILMLVAGVLGLIKQYNLVPSLPVNVNGMFNLWIIALATGLALYHTKLKRWVRGLLLALAVAYVIWGVGLHISWLAGWLPGILALGVLFFRWSRRATAVGLALVAIVVVVNLSYVDNVFMSEDNESGGTRLAAWEMNWTITKDHLLFGTGPAGYAYYYMSYFPTNAMATHSNYIDIVAETGLVGFTLYLLFFGTLAICGLRLCWKVKGRGDFVEALANASFAGTLACIVIMAFGDWLIPFAYTQTIAGFDYAVYNWLFMGAIVALDKLVTNEKAAGPTHA